MIVGIVTASAGSPPPPEKPHLLEGVEVERVVIDARAIAPVEKAIVRPGSATTACAWTAGRWSWSPRTGCGALPADLRRRRRAGLDLEPLPDA
jgi:hypothetical protein